MTIVIGLLGIVVAAIIRSMFLFYSVISCTVSSRLLSSWIDASCICTLGFFIFVFKLVTDGPQTNLNTNIKKPRVQTQLALIHNLYIPQESLDNGISWWKHNENKIKKICVCVTTNPSRFTGNNHSMFWMKHFNIFLGTTRWTTNCLSSAGCCSTHLHDLLVWPLSWSHWLWTTELHKRPEFNEQRKNYEILNKGTPTWR
jgi:hypothetical protein